MGRRPHRPGVLFFRLLQNPLTLGEDSRILTTVALMRCYEPQLALLVLMVVPVNEAVDPASSLFQALEA